VALFTSGVAGRPRPVLLTHANLAAVQTGLIEQPGSGLGPGTVALCPMPISHVFGLNSLVGTMLRAGATIVTAPRFDPAATLELIARHRVTTLSAVPQMWAAWTAVAGASGTEMATVERATSSAAHLPAAVAEAVYGRFGLRVAAGYGLTETSGTICLDDVTNPTTDTVGRPLGGTSLRLVELDDDGRLTIVDRVKDVIIVGGFNVAPAEVEDVLLSHPSVAGAAVVGEPDDRSGERVVAYVVAARGELSTEQLLEHCRRHLARYKVPARIEQRAELPATESGKWVRRLLQ
jgi:long-chain acyl-CoA synthetase